MYFKVAALSGATMNVAARALLVTNVPPLTFSVFTGPCVNNPDDAYLYNALHNSIEGRFDQSFASDPEKRVLEVATRTRVRVGATEDDVVLSVELTILALQFLEHLRGKKWS